MDQEPTDRFLELDDSPSNIRTAMMETRQQLAAHLGALKERLLHPLTARSSPKGPTMPTKKQTSRESGAKRTEKSKPQASRADARTKQSTVAKPAQPSKAAETKTRKENRGKAAAPRKKTAAQKAEVQGLVARTGETLDTMIAGAIVGAVTGAARNLAHEPSAMPLCDETPATQPAVATEDKPTTGQVLEEMASGAAIGALSGTAKAVVPRAPKNKSTSKPKKQKH